MAEIKIFKKWDIVARTGYTLKLQFTWKPAGVVADLTGYAGYMQVRQDENGDSPIVLLEASTVNGKMVLGEEAGTVNIVFTAEDMADWVAPKAYYDVKLVAPNGDHYIALDGAIIRQGSATRLP